MSVPEGFIQYVIGPLVLLIVSSIIAGLRFVGKRFFNTKIKLGDLDTTTSDKLAKVIADISKMHHAMRTIMTHLPTANRVIILRMHNGGGIIQPHTEVYLTALHEVALESTTPILEDIKKRPVDKFHLDNVLTPLILTGSCTLNRSTAEGALKAFYELHNHEWSYTRRLHADEKSMTYLLVSFKEGASEELTPLEAEKLEVGVVAIYNILEKY